MENGFILEQVKTLKLKQFGELIDCFLEGGTNLRYKQCSPGHSSSKITELDTHVSVSNFSRIKNPLDLMG